VSRERLECESEAARAEQTRKIVAAERFSLHPPRDDAPGRGRLLHIDNYPRYERSGAEQLRGEEQAEAKTGPPRFASTIVGLGFGFHLVSVQEVVATLGVAVA
jgi:hypothetical protein